MGPDLETSLGMAHGRRAQDPRERFEKIIGISLGLVPKDGCVIWPNSKNEAGYGRFPVGGGEQKAHVASWVFENGRPVPEGFEVHHRCGERACVNPHHLELKERRPHRSGHRKNYCPNGHLYTEENTATGRRGYRVCKICRAARSARHRAERRRQQSKLPSLLQSWGRRGPEYVRDLWVQLIRERHGIREYWGDAEKAIAGQLLRGYGIDVVEALVPAVVAHWQSFTEFALEFDGGHKPPRWPRIKYLRKHIVAAVNWLPRWQEEQRLDAEHLAQIERAERAREAEERRLRELQHEPFEEVVREKLQEAVTPGTAVHEYISTCLWDGLPLELELQILHQRAVAEAERELGQRRGVRSWDKTQAEREAYLLFIQEH